MENIKTVTSVSGGQTSAYIAANYHSDKLIFSLVRSESKEIAFKDPYLIREVEDRIKKPFVATLEDDLIIKTILDLEQFTGKKIDWVSGITFDQLLKNKKYLPNPRNRFCTTELKIRPIFEWWAKEFNLMPVYMNIGYRLNEQNRALTMLEKTNFLGVQTFKHSFGRYKKGWRAKKNQNRWSNIHWRIPKFPLIEDGLNKVDIVSYWEKHPEVRFAFENNCIGCMNRNPQQLKASQMRHPKKFDWFVDQENLYGKTFKKNIKYSSIKNLKSNFSKNASLFEDGCQSGFCGF